MKICLNKRVMESPDVSRCFIDFMKTLRLSLLSRFLFLDAISCVGFKRKMAG